MKNCNDCGFINITEEEQKRDKTKNHICLKYNQKVIHRSCNSKIEHTYIYPCEQCNGKSFVKMDNSLPENNDYVVIIDEDFKGCIGKVIDTYYGWMHNSYTIELENNKNDKPELYHNQVRKIILHTI